MANLRPLFPGEVEPPEPEHEFQEGRVIPVVIWIHCVILKDGFQPERLTVQLAVPATPEEAASAVQAAREPTVRQLYPHIHDVVPQPSHGTAVYIATPEWCPMLQCACLDMTGLDGRIYAAILPDYIARRELLSLVPSTQAREVDVFIGQEGQPVQNDEHIHLFPGVLITYLPALADPPIPYTMGQLLMMRDVWSPEYSLPIPDLPNACCLVSHGRARLHLLDDQASAQHHNNIADAVGLPAQITRLYAATPTPDDVSEHGVPCHTVIAACDARQACSSVWHAVILDCRHILEDWQELIVPNGRLCLPRLRSQFQESAPAGWRLQFDISNADEDVVIVRPGQVIAVTYAATGSNDIPDPTVEQTDASEPVAQIGGGDETPPSPSSTVSEQPDVDPNTTAVAAAADLESISVYVYSENYTPEHCRVHLPAMFQLHELVAAIEQARNPIAQRIFPDIIPVVPQPDRGLITFLALRFAIFVPAVLTRSDVLFLARCDGAAQCHVHLGDTPWPLPDDGAYPVQAGTLVTIRPWNIALPDMLQLAALIALPPAWDWPYHTPAFWNGGTWLVTDQQSLHASIPPPPNPMLHRDIATVMQVQPDDIHAHYAQPPIWDHAHRGHTSASVLCVADRYAESLLLPHDDVPYILDLRPLLLPLQLNRAPRGVIEIARLYDRLCPRCPLGFCIRIIGGIRDVNTANHWRQVVPGTVIRVELHPASPEPLPPTSAIAPPSPTEDPGLSTHLDQDTLSTSHLSSSTSSGPPADTGGTDRPSSSRTRHGGTTAIRNSPRIHSKRAVRRLPAASPIPPVSGVALPKDSHCVARLAAVIALITLASATCLWHGSDCAIAICTLLYYAVRPMLHTPPRLPLACLILWCLTPTVQAMQIPARHEASTRPTDSSACPQVLCLQGAFAQIARPLPTPCRGRRRAPSDDGRAASSAKLEMSPLQTLLDECSARTSHHYFLAATLLDTLEEHFAQADISATVGVHISLDDSIVWTPFQQQVLSLQTILPPSVATTSVQEADWLDNDRDHLLHDPAVPSEHRAAFFGIKTWHEAGCPRPPLLRIFTDGSATNIAENPTPCAWAFGVWVPYGQEQLLLGYAANTAVMHDSPYHLGEVNDSPQTAEQLAIAWALIWVVDYAAQYSCPVELMYDCLAAGKGAFGDWRMPRQPDDTGTPILAHNLVCLRHLAQAKVRLCHGYVPGHAGRLENEYADQLAKKARRVPDTGQSRLLPEWPARFLRHPLKAWGWASVAYQPDMPTLFAFEAEADRLQSLDLRPTAAPHASKTSPPPKVDCVYNFNVITYNTLTMRDPLPNKAAVPAGMRMTGRKALLKAQLAQYEPLFVGLQETRLPDEGIQPDADYLIYQSAATAAGHSGCALWISKTVPYATRSGKPLYFRHEHVNILGYAPRHLTVCVKAEAFHAFILVCHSPNAYSSPLAEYMDYWRCRAQELARRPSGFDYIILADANARVGSIPTAHVGDCCSEEENHPGEAFHDFLAHNHAFLPSTFSHVHKGEGHTWVSPAGDKHRIDFVVLPLDWQDFKLTSRVLYDLELLQARDDHYPVILQCEFVKHAPSDVYHPATQRRASRPTRPDTPEARAQVIATLSRVPCIPWHEDVDVHYTQLAQAWRDVGSQLDPITAVKPAPTQPYVGAHAQHLVQLRQSLRKYLRAEAAERRRRHLICAFAALWLNARGRAFDDNQRCIMDRWFREMDISEAEALSHLHLYGFYLRKQVAADRRRYLQNLADNVKLQDLRNPHAFYQAVRKAFPAARSARRSSFRPLPAVTDDQGQLVVTPQDRAERWRAFFGAQEAGFPATDQQYVTHLQDMPRLQSRTVFDIHIVPTLMELEQIAQGLHTGRAAGLDCVSGELLQVHVPTTLRQFFPVCLKASLSIREPCQFRGGELICLAKKAGAALHCSGFRSILISSVPGKILHRSLRTRLLDVLSSYRPQLQAGAMPGEGIEYISLAAQCFQQYHEGRRQHWALIFYDVQAAFYSVIRELIVPTSQTDEQLLRFLHDLRVPPTAVAELKQKLEAITLLPTLNASPHLTAAIQDLYRGTWFKMSQSALLTITQRGTRPGDPAADAVFGLAMAALLRNIATCTQTAGINPQVPVCADTPPWATTEGTPTWGCPAWADDFVQPVDGDDGPQLLSRVQAGTGIVAGCVSSLGMRLTFDAEKTAVLLPAWLDTRLSPIQHADQGTGYIPIHDAVTGEQHELPIVHAYKHLGGILTADASPVMDLHHRHSRAAAVIKPLKGKLFACLDQPLPLRRTLLRSLAISKFVHTGAAIMLRAAFHQRIWSQHYIQLWRALVPRVAPDQHIHAYKVLHLAQAPSPPLALAKARAALLFKLTRAGPPSLGYLLFAHWRWAPRTAWLSQLEGDYKVVAAFVPEIRGFLSSTAPVDAILESLSEEPSWWLRQVRKACRVFHDDIERWHLQGPAHLPTPTPTTQPQSRPYSCHVCSASFILRKHLGVHLARAHGIISPARHFAPVDHCIACLRYYGQVPRVQMHLKQKHSCLLRCAHLFPPMDMCDIRHVERAAAEAKRQMRKGVWKSYVPPPHVSTIQGPPLPTRQERYPNGEDIVLSDLKPVYVPPPSVIAWITSYIDGSSKEGPRQTAASFWCNRPSFTYA